MSLSELSNTLWLCHLCHLICTLPKKFYVPRSWSRESILDSRIDDIGDKNQAASAMANAPCAMHHGLRLFDFESIILYVPKRFIGFANLFCSFIFIGMMASDNPNIA